MYSLANRLYGSVAQSTAIAIGDAIDALRNIPPIAAIFTGAAAAPGPLGGFVEVIAMTVSVAGSLVPRDSALSDAARLVLQLIDGGAEWLEWAILQRRAHYSFDTEEALAGAVQCRLYGRPLMLVRPIQLLVDPAKLMTLELRDLRILAEAKEDSGTAGEVLARYGLVGKPALARDLAALRELVGDRPWPVLQCMSLEERLEIHALMGAGEALPEGDRRAAVRFAAERAGSPGEFADYVRTYLHHVAANPGPPDKGGSQKRRVGDSVDLLLPLLFEALDGPCVRASAKPEEVAEAIEEWLLSGRPLGFARRSKLAEQVIGHTRFARRDSDEEATQILAVYLRRAQALIGSCELGPRRLGQDGTSTFRIHSAAEEALVTLNRQGVIALCEFRPLPEEPLPAPEPAGAGGPRRAGGASYRRR